MLEKISNRAMYKNLKKQEKEGWAFFKEGGEIDVWYITKTEDRPEAINFNFTVGKYEVEFHLTQEDLNGLQALLDVQRANRVTE